MNFYEWKAEIIGLQPSQVKDIEDNSPSTLAVSIAEAHKAFNAGLAEGRRLEREECALFLESLSEHEEYKSLARWIRSRVRPPQPTSGEEPPQPDFTKTVTSAMFGNETERPEPKE